MGPIKDISSSLSFINEVSQRRKQGKNDYFKVTQENGKSNIHITGKSEKSKMNEFLEYINLVTKNKFLRSQPINELIKLTHSLSVIKNDYKRNSLFHFFSTIVSTLFKTNYNKNLENLNKNLAELKNLERDLQNQNVDIIDMGHDLELFKMDLDQQKEEIQSSQFKEVPVNLPEENSQRKKEFESEVFKYYHP